MLKKISSKLEAHKLWNEVENDGNCVVTLTTTPSEVVDALPVVAEVLNELEDELSALLKKTGKTVNVGFDMEWCEIRIVLK